MDEENDLKHVSLMLRTLADQIDDGLVKLSYYRSATETEAVSTNSGVRWLVTIGLYKDLLIVHEQALELKWKRA